MRQSRLHSACFVTITIADGTDDLIHEASRANDQFRDMAISVTIAT